MWWRRRRLSSTTVSRLRLSRSNIRSPILKLQAAYQAGNVSLQSGGGEGEITLVIKNYIKPGDSVTLTFGRQEKAIQSVKVGVTSPAPPMR